MTSSQRKRLLWGALMVTLLVSAWSLYSPAMDEDDAVVVTAPHAGKSVSVFSHRVADQTLLTLPSHPATELNLDLFAYAMPVATSEPQSLQLSAKATMALVPSLPFQLVGLLEENTTEQGPVPLASVQANDDIYVLRTGDLALGYRFVAIETHGLVKRLVFEHLETKRKQYLEVGE